MFTRMFTPRTMKGSLAWKPETLSSKGGLNLSTHGLTLQRLHDLLCHAAHELPTRNGYNLLISLAPYVF